VPPEAVSPAESKLPRRVSAQRQLPDHRAPKGGAHVQARNDIRQEHVDRAGRPQYRRQHQSQRLAGLSTGEGPSDLPRWCSHRGRGAPGILRRPITADNRAWTRHAGGISQLTGSDTVGRVVAAT